MKTALVIIAPKQYQDIELDGTRKALLEMGFTVVIGSTEIGICTGKYGGSEKAQVALRDVDVSAYDRIAFIGGPGAEVLRDDIYAMAVAKAAADAHMPLGAICIAPTILAAAGVLESKRATCFMGDDGLEAEFLEDHGATFVHEDVVIDDHLVTANGPEAAEEFGKVFGGMAS